MHIVIYTKEDDDRLPQYREMLREAMQEVNLLPAWDEIVYTNDTGKSAAITIDKSNAWSEKSGHRLSVQYLQNALHKQLNPGNKTRLTRAVQKYLSFILALFIAFFPKCPMCWAAWLSGLGLISANTIPYRPWYLFISIGLIVLNIIVLYLLNRKHNLLPLAINMGGAFLIIINRFTINTNWLMVTGGLLLIAGAAWSSLPGWMKKVELSSR